MEKKTSSHAGPHGKSDGPRGKPRVNHRDRRRRAKPAVSSRLVVLDLMSEIIGKGHPLQEAIKRHEDWGKLDDRDRRFARRLITIILRHRRNARLILNRYLKKPVHRKDRKAEAVLILAVVELIWADGDAHAAVDQAVRMMRGKGFTHMTGLANAVLRKVAQDQAILQAEAHDPMINAPSWLQDHLRRDWPEHAQHIMASFLAEPSLDFTCASTPELWAEKLNGVMLAHGSIRRRDGNPATMDGYDDGGWWVQDAAATIPALLLQSTLIASEGRSSDSDLNGKTVIDLCAAPGGKTAQLVAMGADVIAIDSSAERLKTLKANMKRLNMTPAVITADGTSWTPDEKVDAVLLDAPCSATGTLRRRPDILSHDHSPDLDTLNKAQQDLFAAAATWLKPGGVLIYATCSILKAEGEHIVKHIPTGLTASPISPDEIDGIKMTINADGYARVMPDAIDVTAAKITPEDMDTTDDIPQGNDGFFIARFIAA